MVLRRCIVRVFVYSKKTSKKLAQINDVANVKINSKKKLIVLRTVSGEVFEFNTTEVKTTTSQN